MFVIVASIAVVALVMLIPLGLLLRQVRQQQDRLQQRLDTVLERVVAAVAEPVARAQRAPDFELPALDGSHIRRDTLLARGQPLLLVFTDPRCGPCYELLPDIGGWQRYYGDRLTIALVSAGTPQTNRAMTAEYGIDLVLLQDENALEFRDAYGLKMAPAAVIVQADGALRGEPAYGAPAVRQLVADTLGLALPAPPARMTQSLTVGAPAPRFRRPDLDGNPVDLADFLGAPTLLLFWSPGCQHCQAVRPLLQRWKQHPGEPQLLIVSHGPVALNKEAGLPGPVVLDDDRALMDAFGVTGTPAAVLIDSAGRIASQAVRGEQAVHALLMSQSQQALEATAAD